MGRPRSDHGESVHRAVASRGSASSLDGARSFARWVHEHRFEQVSANASWLVDDVEYDLPRGPLRLASSLVAKRVERMFTFRHQVTLAAMNELVASR